MAIDTCKIKLNGDEVEIPKSDLKWFLENKKAVEVKTPAPKETETKETNKKSETTK
jgi:hypothetical protein